MARRVRRATRRRSPVRAFGPDDPLTRDIGENLRVALRNTHRF
ncbi:hypothetical protein ACIBP4_06750 [Micromonospora maritima]|uniref:Uncharacterized protein n=1 Tax=Micromonospora maritima TaxID=986711 RepID=A0ABW7ZGM6_9ACTN